MSDSYKSSKGTIRGANGFIATGADDACAELNRLTADLAAATAALKSSEERLAEATDAGRMEQATRDLPAALEAEMTTKLCLTLGDLLRHTADALKGDPGYLKGHSTHDLPDVAAALVKRLAAEREAVRVLGEAMFWSREYASNAVPTTFELMRRAREAVEGNPIARAALTPPAPAQEPRA